MLLLVLRVLVPVVPPRGPVGGAIANGTNEAERTKLSRRREGGGSRGQSQVCRVTPENTVSDLFGEVLSLIIRSLAQRVGLNRFEGRRAEEAEEKWCLERR